MLDEGKLRLSILLGGWYLAFTTIRLGTAKSSAACSAEAKYIAAISSWFWDGWTCAG